jgi:hypothetical protein
MGIGAMYKQKIIHFFCRPCAEYHLKTHPHYRAMKRRAAARRKAKELKAAQGVQEEAANEPKI